MGPTEAKRRPSRSRPPAAGGGAGRWLPVAALALATLVLFRGVMLEGLTFVSPDATAPVGFVRVGERELARGVYPLWNPYLFCGMPSFASLAYNPWIYPPDWPLALVQKVLPLPDLTWLVLYYFLGGLGVFLLCREWGVERWGATLAGLAFLSVPNLVAVGAHGHGSQLVDSAYIPWMLWLAARFLHRGGIADLSWLALAGGFQFLRGHVQIGYYTWLAIGLYTAVEVLRPAAGSLGRRLGRAAGVAAAGALAAGLAAFLYLPVREYARYSIRGAAEGGGVPYDYATAWSLHPIEIATFLIPGFAGFGGHTYWGGMPFTDYPHYMGLAVLLLALAGLVGAARRGTAFFLAVLGLFALALSLGKNSLLYGFFFEWMPYFNKFRVPVMVLVLLQLAVAVAAGLGLSSLLAPPAGRAAGRDLRLTAGLGVAAVVFALGLLPDLWRDAYLGWVRGLRPDFPEANAKAAFDGAARDATRVGFFALVALGGAALARRRTIPVAAAATAVCLVTVADLWIVDHRILEPVLGPRVESRRESERDDIVTFLESRAGEGAFRIVPVQDFQSNRYAGFAIASLGGYHAAKPRLVQDYLDRGAHFAPLQSLLGGQGWREDAFWNVANVRYVVVPGTLPEGSPLVPVHQGSQVVFENPNALPRASLGTRYEVVPPADQLGRLLAADHDEHAVVLLERPPASPPGPESGTVRIVEYGLNTVRMETDAPNPTILRFADLYFPGWRATIDGAETEILRADHAFRAILVPAGRHRIEWRYESDALRAGLLLTAVAAAVAGLFGIAAWRRRKAPG